MHADREERVSPEHECLIAIIGYQARDYIQSTPPEEPYDHHSILF